MDGTIIGQGSFTQGATATNQVVAIPSGVDWIATYNKTAIDAGTASTGTKFFWQRGMPAGYAIEYQTNAGGNATFVKSVTTGGFTLYDPSGQTPGALALYGNSVAATGISNATKPVVTTGTTTGLVADSSIVRLSIQSGDTAIASALMGMDLSVDAVSAGVSFTVPTDALANTLGITTGTLHYRTVNYSPLFYPRRFITINITKATNGIVTTNIPHGYQVGQLVRFSIPAVSGMVQLDQQTATVLTVPSTTTFTINIDTSAYTTFTFPTVAQQPSNFPQVVPVGEDTAQALLSVVDILTDATVNTGFIGMVLPSGADSPGGQANDTVFWIAGKSTYGGQ